MNLLVLNCGSSTVKYKLYSADGDSLTEHAAGNTDVEDDYDAAIGAVIAALPSRPDAVAHRVVHGGDFRRPAVIDAGVLARIERLSDLAPLHNPPALAGIRAGMALDVPQVAAFDTAFFQTLPEVAYTTAIPKELREAHRIRRYGFHGQSHRYVSLRYAEISGNPAPTIVTLHLGSGASAAAIAGGRAVDTTMGMTPLPGLLMSTREGDMDPGVCLHLLRTGMPIDDVERVIWHESGFLALAGTRNMRTLIERTDDDARLAVEIFCYRVRKAIGAYLAALGGAEAVVFTGGIGEHAPAVRRRVVEPLAFLGLVLDPAANDAGACRITAPDSPVGAFVIPTDEERMIATDALATLRA